MKNKPFLSQPFIHYFQVINQILVDFQQNWDLNCNQTTMRKSDFDSEGDWLTKTKSYFKSDGNQTMMMKSDL